MATLSSSDQIDASSRPIPAHAQLLAVAWLRWRIFVNNFRRQRSDSTVIALIFVVLLRVVVWGIIGFGLISAAAFCGYLAWKAVGFESSLGLTSLLAGIALFWQFFSINGLSIAATLPSFDPSSLLRFPLRFGRYLLLRTLLGLLSPVTIAGCLTLLASAIGIGIANHALLLPALIVLAVYALMNVFLTRMIEAWFERWLAVRRFREIFSAVMAFFFVGIQFLNFGSASSPATCCRLVRSPASCCPIFALAATGLRRQLHPACRGTPSYSVRTILGSARRYRALLVCLRHPHP